MKDAYRYERATADLICQTPGDPFCWEITSIRNSGERGQGHASAVLRLVCADADAEDVVLTLVPSSSDPDGLQDEELEEWYGRYGFVLIDPEGNTKMKYIMVRGPRMVANKIDSDD